MMSENIPQTNGEKPVEKFPKLNTIPKGWDLSEYLPNPEMSQDSSSKENDLNPVRPMEKFPRLNTIPRGWDLSDHIKE